MRERISGIVPPMTTPFRPDDTIDEGALRAEARYAISHDNLPANVKHCQELQGRAAGVPRAPMPATSPVQASAIREALHHAGLV